MNDSVSTPQLPITIGVTGASGLIYAVRTIKFLLASNYTIDLVASKATYSVWQAEQNIKMPAEAARQEKFWREQAGEESNGKLCCHAWQDIGANIASGSYR
ncbi:MAG: aromatic acid decarboxylase, partial [Okeania sp. SIO2H7]|nr:aromatic acid decarboxylase [Okeania sp. SIO2H7]